MNYYIIALIVFIVVSAFRKEIIDLFPYLKITHIYIFTILILALVSMFFPIPYKGIGGNEKTVKIYGDYLVDSILDNTINYDDSYVLSVDNGYKEVKIKDGTLGIKDTAGDTKFHVIDKEGNEYITNYKTLVGKLIEYTTKEEYNKELIKNKEIEEVVNYQKTQSLVLFCLFLFMCVIETIEDKFIVDGKIKLWG